MRVTATLREVDGHVLAECKECSAEAEGATASAALAALHAALVERAVHVEAIAPPSRPEAPEIEIVVVPYAIDSTEHSPEGPGEA